MAVSKPVQKQSKKFVMSLISLILVGWLVLFFWALSLWGLSGFDSAEQRVNQLVVQQSGSIAEFDSPMFFEYLVTLFSSIPKNKITNTHDKIKEELNQFLPESNSQFDMIVHDLTSSFLNIGTLIHLATKLMLIKLTILITAVPLFVLTSTAGLVDGLNQRAIRRASLGRESTYMFHQLNRYIKRGLLLILAFWLAIPIPIQPALIFVPVSILFSVMVSMTTSRFKKYL